MTILFVVVSCVTQEEEYVDLFYLEQEEATIKKVPLADPYILVENGMYYAYGTTDANNGFWAFASKDLITWERSRARVLYKDNVIGDTWFWAPEVYRFENKFYMFYAAEERIAVATASSPLGPFVQYKQEWLIDRNSIDGCVFSEENQFYFYYVNRVDWNIGNCIYVERFDGNYFKLDHSTSTYCIGPSQQWEMDMVNEGPSVFKVGKKYVMTYSGGGYGNPDYGVGVAVADDPMGPWVKYEGNPVMQYPVYKGTVLQGTGHNSLFKDLDGNWRMVFHAHSAKGISGGRYMYIVSVDLMDEPPYIVFHDDLFAPVIAEE